MKTGILSTVGYRYLILGQQESNTYSFFSYEILFQNYVKIVVVEVKQSTK